MNLSDLLPTVRKLSNTQKLTLIEELKSELESSAETVTAWDLSEPSIASRNAATLALLDKWETEGDEQEQTETWEFLQQALDEDRLSSHRPFFPSWLICLSSQAKGYEVTIVTTNVGHLAQFVHASHWQDLPIDRD